MITIRTIRDEEIPAAKRVILSVAYNIFGFDGTLEDSIRQFLAAGKLKDLDDGLITQLFDFARKQDYTRVRLQTSPEQIRALAFYRKVGFHEIPCYNDGVGEISMEAILPE